MGTASRSSAPETNGTNATANGKRGLIDLARIAVEDVVRLVQQEIRLAKLELREMVVSNVRAAILLSAAGACAILFLVMLLVTVALLIPDHALAAGIETAIFLLLAVILGFAGKAMLKIGPPQKTMTSLKEDAEWARQVLKRNGK